MFPNPPLRARVWRRFGTDRSHFFQSAREVELDLVSRAKLHPPPDLPVQQKRRVFYTLLVLITSFLSEPLMNSNTKDRDFGSPAQGLSSRKFINEFSGPATQQGRRVRGDLGSALIRRHGAFWPKRQPISFLVSAIAELADSSTSKMEVDEC
jgi:hypothetical protein